MNDVNSTRIGYLQEDVDGRSRLGSRLGWVQESILWQSVLCLCVCERKETKRMCLRTNEIKLFSHDFLLHQESVFCKDSLSLFSPLLFLSRQFMQPNDPRKLSLPSYTSWSHCKQISLTLLYKLWDLFLLLPSFNLFLLTLDNISQIFWFGVIGFLVSSKT